VISPSSLLRSAFLASTALAMALPAHAQEAPPARVGQLASVSGDVSFNGAASNGQWVAATPNYPVTAGDSLFTQDGAQAAVALDSSRINLAGNTEMQVTELDDDNFTATESQGEVFFTLNDVQPAQSFTLNTPGGAVNFAGDGEYDVTAGNASNPTSIAVLAGSASAGGMQISAGQEGYLYAGTPGAQIGSLQQDDFMQQVLAQIAPPPPPYVPPVVAQMSGVDELAGYGQWQESPDYGAIWYPEVAVGWAPYQQGHWAFIPPWGWTWVEDEPWGFAPFHYGRWVHRDDRWGWVPAGAYDHGHGGWDHPVYAPALVGFVGLGGRAPGADDFRSGAVHWVPLAPGEAYYPSYHAPSDYVRRLNGADVHDFTPGRPAPSSFSDYANHGGYPSSGGGEHGGGVILSPTLTPVPHGGEGFTAPQGQHFPPQGQGYPPQVHEYQQPQFHPQESQPLPQVQEPPQQQYQPPLPQVHEYQQPQFHPQESQPLPQVQEPPQQQYQPPQPQVHEYQQQEQQQSQPQFQQQFHPQEHNDQPQEQQQFHPPSGGQQQSAPQQDDWHKNKHDQGQ